MPTGFFHSLLYASSYSMKISRSKVCGIWTEEAVLLLVESLIDVLIFSLLNVPNTITCICLDHICLMHINRCHPLRIADGKPPFLLVLDASNFKEVPRVEFKGVHTQKDIPACLSLSLVHITTH